MAPSGQIDSRHFAGFGRRQIKVSDILDAVSQQEIGNSILDAPIVGSWKDGALAEEAQPESQEQSGADIDQFIANEAARRNEAELASLHTDRERGEPEQQQEQTRPEQQSQPQTQEQDNLPSLAEAIETYQLSSPDSNRELSTEICSALRMDVEHFGKVNADSLGGSLSEIELAGIDSFIRANGDLSKISGNVPLETANAFMHKFYVSMGDNPQLVESNRQQATNVFWVRLSTFWTLTTGRRAQMCRC
jgi:hypothetical protein